MSLAHVSRRAARNCGVPQTALHFRRCNLFVAIALPILQKMGLLFSRTGPLKSRWIGQFQRLPFSSDDKPALRFTCGGFLAIYLPPLGGQYAQDRVVESF